MLLERPAYHRQHQHGHVLMHDDPHSFSSYRRSQERVSTAPSASSSGRRRVSASSVFDSMKGRGIIAHWTAKRNGEGRRSKQDSSVAAQVNMEGGRDGETSAGGGVDRSKVHDRHNRAPPGSFDLEGWLSGGSPPGGNDGAGAFHSHGRGAVGATARSSSFAAPPFQTAMPMPTAASTRFVGSASRAQHHPAMSMGSADRHRHHVARESVAQKSGHEPWNDSLHGHMSYSYSPDMWDSDFRDTHTLHAGIGNSIRGSTGQRSERAREAHPWKSKTVHDESIAAASTTHNNARHIRHSSAPRVSLDSIHYDHRATTLATGNFATKSVEFAEYDMMTMQRVRFTGSGTSTETTSTGQEPRRQEGRSSGESQQEQRQRQQQAQRQPQDQASEQRTAQSAQRAAPQGRQPHSQEQQQQPRRVWKTAVDPKSGRTYYYDAVTRETQWRKPLDLATAEERRAIQRKERKQKEFFAAMEANILRCMQKGQLPGSPKEGEEREEVGEMRQPSPAKKAMVQSLPVTAVEKAGAKKGKLLPKALKPTGRPVRTISMMGEALIAEITKVEGDKRKASPPSVATIRGGPSPNSVTNFPGPAFDSSGSLSVSSSSFGSRGSSSGSGVSSSSSMSMGATPMVGHHTAALPSRPTAGRAQHRRTGSDGSKDRAIEQVRAAADEMMRAAPPAADEFSPLLGDNLIDSRHSGSGSSDDGVAVPPPKSADLKNLSKPALVNRNTCGTIYVKSTMSAPDKDATIKCVCGVYRAHMLQAAKDEASTGFRPPVRFDEYEIFNDRPSDRRSDASPPRTPRGKFTSAVASTIGSLVLSQSQTGIEALSLESVEGAVPTLEDITAFYRDVFRRSQMETDCIIMSLIYVERLIKETNGGIRPRVGNWRSVLFASMVMASKVWDDLSMWNADFSQTCPAGVRFTLRRINELELAMLGCLKFSVKVPASEYAKYYFLLRSMMIRSGLAGDDLPSMTPLDVEGARKLEVMSGRFRTDGERDSLRAASLRDLRSKSCGEVEWRRGATAGGGGGGGDRSSPTSSVAGAASKVNLEQVVNL